MALQWWKTAALVAAMGVYGSGCIINVGPGGTRAQYESCNTGDSCRGLSTCQTSAISLAGMGNGSFCTESCSTDSSCPASPTTGNTAVCLSTTGGAGQCFAKCMTATDCPSGSTCGEVMRGGTAVRACIPGGASAPCGGTGQACCGGTTCNESANTCASDGICKPKAYNGCTAASASANLQCTDAIANAGGNRIQTTCQRPPFTNAGPAGFCTAVCNGTNESCPQFPGSTSGCYRFEGMTVPMCFVDCVTNPAICPAGTACVMLTSNSGAQVRVCAPPVT